MCFLSLFSEVGGKLMLKVRSSCIVISPWSWVGTFPGAGGPMTEDDWPTQSQGSLQLPPTDILTLSRARCLKRSGC